MQSLCLELYLEMNTRAALEIYLEMYSEMNTRAALEMLVITTAEQNDRETQEKCQEMNQRVPCPSQGPLITPYSPLL